MGTWDVGPFDNDAAGDFCAALDEASADAREGIVRDTLARVAGTRDYLEADEAEEAVAAAALIAAQCHGGPSVDRFDGPEEPLPDLTGLRSLAVQALDRVVSEPSELPELWDDASDSTPWRASIDGLRTILLPQATADQHL
ncbi:DUF4259 domain-containing protein [Streptomyces sp. CA-250714]|uniref:DUF4259 domain-containing protein n=1 Tax=Streptomyces sp. CA-250714 TaxID=3240060 RepID=UPI003D925587